jgi:hypothetical protein
MLSVYGAFFSFLVVLGIEHRASCLLGWYSTTWTMAPQPFPCSHNEVGWHLKTFKIIYQRQFIWNMLSNEHYKMENDIWSVLLLIAWLRREQRKESIILCLFHFAYYWKRDSLSYNRRNAHRNGGKPLSTSELVKNPEVC